MLRSLVTAGQRPPAAHTAAPTPVQPERAAAVRRCTYGASGGLVRSLSLAPCVADAPHGVHMQSSQATPHAHGGKSAGVAHLRSRVHGAIDAHARVHGLVHAHVTAGVRDGGACRGPPPPCASGMCRELPSQEQALRQQRQPRQQRQKRHPEWRSQQQRSALCAAAAKGEPVPAGVGRCGRMCATAWGCAWACCKAGCGRMRAIAWGGLGYAVKPGVGGCVQQLGGGLGYAVKRGVGECVQ
eukprot:355151-Chlamydomonas_euryale.AAC.1